MPGGRGSRTLVALEVLMVDDPDRPRALGETSEALERLDWIGKPVVLVGEEISGRRLPVEPDDRIAWVRQALDRPDLDVALFDEPPVERLGEPAGGDAVERWRAIGETWGAGRLVTRRTSSVGPARSAGLEVVRVGPRDTTTTASIERPDHEARDLIDAVSRLLVADTFSTDPEARPPDRSG